MQPRIILRPGKDKALRQGHPWIFSGAIATGAVGANGDMYPVFDAKGQRLGTGYFNAKSSICGRMICFDDREPLAAIRSSVSQAIALRRTLFSGDDTTGYRLINGEGDFLPGLVVDRYGDVLVLQISTKGMERLRDVIVEALEAEINSSRLYEKSTMPSRREEGLEFLEKWWKGEPLEKIPFREHRLQY